MGFNESMHIRHYRKRFAALEPKIERLKLRFLRDKERYSILREIRELQRDITNSLFSWELFFNEIQENLLLELAITCKHEVQKFPRFRKPLEKEFGRAA